MHTVALGKEVFASHNVCEFYLPEAIADDSFVGFLVEERATVIVASCMLVHFAHKTQSLNGVLLPGNYCASV
jgi:hypothetical protein